MNPFLCAQNNPFAPKTQVGTRASGGWLGSRGSLQITKTQGIIRVSLIWGGFCKVHKKKTLQVPCLGLGWGPALEGPERYPQNEPKC